MSHHNPSTLVLDVILPPALHIKLLGIVNKLYGRLHKLFPKLDDCPTSLYIVKENYHGQTFEGSECNKLLDKLNMLSNMLPGHLMPFHRCFVAFNHAIQDHTIQASLGFILHEAYLEKISEFDKAYKTLKNSYNLKGSLYDKTRP